MRAAAPRPAPIASAASTTSGNGASSRNSAANAATASACWIGVLSARPAMRNSAWAMIASTAALIPRNSAANQARSAAKA